MKVLHIMRKSHFSKSIAGFMDRRFDHDVHEICYFLSDNDDSYIDHEFTIRQYEFKLFMKKCAVHDYKEFYAFQKKYDYIVLHSHFINPMISLLLGMKSKRIIWISWGYDLQYFVNRKQNNDIKFKINYYLRNRIGTFVGIFPPDCDCFKTLFPKSKARVVYVPYRTDIIDPVYLAYNNDSRLKTTIRENSTVYIQIGHCAYEGLNHLAVLQRLSKYSDKNIHIIMPMSYGGSEDYINQVTDCAEKLFSNKYTILRELLPLNEYNSFVDRVDIGIFEVNRQIGLGNINRMIANNVKLYMPSSSVMYDYFTSRGIPIQQSEEIGAVDYEEFVSLISFSEFPGVKKYINECASIDYTMKKWNQLFDQLEER